MNFLTVLALAMAAFVGLPYLAHKLRRKNKEEHFFAALHFVTEAKPELRQPKNLDDKFLFFMRALMVLSLALLASSPYVHCNQLSLNREGEKTASVFIVIDDSMSMSAKLKDSGKHFGGDELFKFDKALAGAKDLVSSLRLGDEVTLIAAGKPARILLFRTQDFGAAKSVLDNLKCGDFATDLEGAALHVKNLAAQTKLAERDVYVFSDMYEETKDPIFENDGSGLRVFYPIEELRQTIFDCGIADASQNGRGEFRVRVLCGGYEDGSKKDSLLSRKLQLFYVEQKADQKKERWLSDSSLKGERDQLVYLQMPSDFFVDKKKDGTQGEASNRDEAKEDSYFEVRLSGEDDIKRDDSLVPFLEDQNKVITWISEKTDVKEGESLERAGSKAVLEKAILALRWDEQTRPLSTFPDSPEETRFFDAVILDDIHGFHSEERKSFQSYLENGGMALLALGPKAAKHTLGLSFEPLFHEPFFWKSMQNAITKNTKSLGEEESEKGKTWVTAKTLSASSHPTWMSLMDSLGEFATEGKIEWSKKDLDSFNVHITWEDGSPLLLSREIKKGAVWVLGLPFSPARSDFSLRSAFLQLLSSFYNEVKLRSNSNVSQIGAVWPFHHTVPTVPNQGRLLPLLEEGSLQVRGPEGEKVDILRTPFSWDVRPKKTGRYRLRYREKMPSDPESSFTGVEQVRWIMPAPQEFQFHAKVPSQTWQESHKVASFTKRDLSFFSALLLLIFAFFELVTRFVLRTKWKPWPRKELVLNGGAKK